LVKVIAFVCTYAWLTSAAPGEFGRHFDYDRSLPLDLAEKLAYERDSVRVLDITYASPRGGRVTGYLVEPKKAKGRRPGVVFGHWGPGDRSEFLPEAELYARAGAVCVLIDYPWKRPAPWHSDADDIMEPEKGVAVQAHAVVDLRRALDLLQARSGVDAERIGYIGHSYGAQFGAIISAVDKRPKAMVLMGGIPDLDSIFLDSQSVPMKTYREKNEQQIRTALKILRATAAVEFVPFASPTPLLFQFARHEWNFDVPAMERYFKAASEPKQVLWYETGHELNDPRALTDRARWIANKLGLTGISRGLRQSTAPSNRLP
jgi:dienelactone hydrolase